MFHIRGHPRKVCNGDQIMRKQEYTLAKSRPAHWAGLLDISLEKGIGFIHMAQQPLEILDVANAVVGDIAAGQCIILQ